MILKNKQKKYIFTPINDFKFDFIFIDNTNKINFIKYSDYHKIKKDIKELFNNTKIISINKLNNELQKYSLVCIPIYTEDTRLKLYEIISIYENKRRINKLTKCFKELE